MGEGQEKNRHSERKRERTRKRNRGMEGGGEREGKTELAVRTRRALTGMLTGPSAISARETTTKSNICLHVVHTGTCKKAFKNTLFIKNGCSSFVVLTRIARMLHVWLLTHKVRETARDLIMKSWFTWPHIQWSQFTCPGQMEIIENFYELVKRTQKHCTHGRTCEA